MSSQPKPTGLRRLPFVPLFLALLATSCVGGDAPTDPERATFSPTAQLAVAPQFVETSGQALSAAAAQEAFDQLTCFELVAERVSTGEVVAEETFRVEPGQDEYSLSVEVELEETPERFRVSLTAFASAGGDACGFELFSGTSEVEVDAEGLSDGEESEATTLDLAPSGPSAEASELTLEPGHAVLSGGGTVQLEPTLLDDAGEVIAEGGDLAEVLSWTASGSAATVDASGEVSGSSDGTAEVTATTTTGLSATIPVYLATGEFAYVSGGSLIRTTVDGEEAETVASGASRPAWRPDGSGLAYESGGSIVEAGGGTLLSGAGSPAFSPNGAHVAGASGGSLAFATADGAFQTETAGPTGSAPQWLDAQTLIVDGGSIERVRADGGDRTTLADHSSDRLPALGGGQIAFLSSRDGGSTGVFVVDAGGGEPTRITPDGFTASGRPAISGSWILVAGSSDAGSGLHLVPADGSEPPLPLPIAGGDDPAWRPSGGGGAPASLQLTGTDPARPLGGREVTLTGSGFDWIVPVGNTVEVPVLSAASAPGQAGVSVPGDATAEAEVLEVTEGGLTFLAPDNLAGGTLTARTPFSEASLELTPASGDLEVVAETPDGKLVEDVEIEVLNADGRSLTSAATDETGTVVFEELTVGDYTLDVAPPEGFRTSAEVGPVVIALDETTTATLDITAVPRSVELSTSSLTFKRTGLTESVDVTVRDVDGDLVTADLSVDRVPASVVQVRVVDASTLEVESRAMGTATVTVTASAETEAAPAAGANADANAQTRPAATSADDDLPTATLEVEVQGGITGSVTDQDGNPRANVRLRLLQEETVLQRASTGDDGTYAFSRLEPGDYTVTITVPDDFTLEGEPSRSIHLGATNPRPEVDFVLIGDSGGSGGGDLVVFNDTNIFDDTAMEDEGNQTMVTNLVTYSGAGSRASGTVVWSDEGHFPYRVSGQSIFQTVIAEAGMNLQSVNSSQDVSLAEIPPEVKVIFLWTPSVSYTTAEINGLKSFADEGGRIVFVGEYEGFYSWSDIQNVQNPLLAALGTDIENQGGAFDSGFTPLPEASIRSHQVTEGVTTFVHAASSEVTVGANGTPLFFDTTNSHIMAAVGAVDVTPLATTAGPAARQSDIRLQEGPTRGNSGVDLTEMSEAEIERAAAGLSPESTDDEQDIGSIELRQEPRKR